MTALPIFTYSKEFAMYTADNFAALTAELQRYPDRAVLRYEVKNLASAELFLFNKMYRDVDDHGRYRVAKDTCNIEVRADRIVIGKCIPAVPEMMFVEVANIPCVTAVPPGGTFTEAVELRLPLTQWTPYASVSRANRLVTLPVFFELGYFVANEQTRSMAKDVATTSATALRFEPFSPSSQIMLTVGPFIPLDIYI